MRSHRAGLPNVPIPHADDAKPAFWRRDLEDRILFLQLTFEAFPLAVAYGLGYSAPGPCPAGVPLLTMVNGKKISNRCCKKTVSAFQDFG
jgi:hypothetical protein